MGTYHDFLIPVTLDFIKVIKEAGPDAYLALLPKFMVALWITRSSNYYRAFSLWIGDLAMSAASSRSSSAAMKPMGWCMLGRGGGNSGSLLNSTRSLAGNAGSVSVDM